MPLGPQRSTHSFAQLAALVQPGARPGWAGAALGLGLALLALGCDRPPGDDAPGDGTDAERRDGPDGSTAEDAVGTGCSPDLQAIAATTAQTVSVLLADERGAVVFWGGDFPSADPERAPVRATRPGEEPVVLVDGRPVSYFLVHPISTGFLLCTVETDDIAATFQTVCHRLDRDLGIDGPPTTRSQRMVRSFVELDGVSHAVVITETGSAELIPFDARGEFLDPPRPLPPSCAPASGQGDRLLCAQAPDPGCGAFDEPSQCSWIFRLLDPSLVPLAEVAGPVGFVNWLQTTTVEGDFLVAWTTRPDGTADRDGDTLRLLRLHTSGKATELEPLAGIRQPLLRETPRGLWAVTAEPAPAPSGAYLIAGRQLDPAGQVVAGPLELGTSPPITGQFDASDLQLAFSDAGAYLGFSALDEIGQGQFYLRDLSCLRK